MLLASPDAITFASMIFWLRRSFTRITSSCLPLATRQVNELLEQRSAGSLEGLESVQDIQRSGKETLLFSAWRQLGEPAAAVLGDGMST